jgi:ATP-dependent DNA helicase DinG
LAERSCSLLALRSFWEGFDATGDTLRCVVIPKLPFSSPTDPLVRERELREDRSWWRHSLPEAVISVKQAAGRLIRTSTDTGILVLADSRIVTKRYGRQFTSSLPTSDFSRLGRADIGRYIEDWRLSHE